MNDLQHPLPTGTTVTALVPVCACLGRSFDRASGNVTEVLHLNGLYWYRIGGSNSLIRQDKIISSP